MCSLWFKNFMVAFVVRFSDIKVYHWNISFLFFSVVTIEIYLTSTDCCSKGMFPEWGIESKYFIKQKSMIWWAGVTSVWISDTHFTHVDVGVWKWKAKCQALSIGLPQILRQYLRLLDTYNKSRIVSCCTFFFTIYLFIFW